MRNCDEIDIQLLNSAIIVWNGRSPMLHVVVRNCHETITCHMLGYTFIMSMSTNLFQLSYGAASLDLSNRDVYPFFYRTYPTSDIGQNKIRVRLLRQFGWSRVATIQENLDVFAHVRTCFSVCAWCDVQTSPFAKRSYPAFGRFRFFCYCFTCQEIFRNVKNFM